MKHRTTSIFGLQIILMLERLKNIIGATNWQLGRIGIKRLIIACSNNFRETLAIALS
jgi:hypothetical protein